MYHGLIVVILDVTFFLGGGHDTTSKPHVVQHPGWALSAAKNATCIFEAQLQAALGNERSALYLQIVKLFGCSLDNLRSQYISMKYSSPACLCIFHMLQRSLISSFSTFITFIDTNILCESSSKVGWVTFPALLPGPFFPRWRGSKTETWRLVQKRSCSTRSCRTS